MNIDFSILEKQLISLWFKMSFLREKCKWVSQTLVYYYDLMILELIKERNLVLGLTQENLIEDSVQDHLPYILKSNGLCSTTLAYSK